MRRIAFTTGAFLLIALGIGVRQYLLNISDETVSGGASTPAGVSTGPIASSSSSSRDADLLEGASSQRKMADEPRDPSWSTAAEARLRNLVTAGTEQLTIRAIECRRSLCAAEVATIDGPYLYARGKLLSDEWMRGNLFPAMDLDGYELDPSGLRVNVMLIVFERRR